MSFNKCQWIVPHFKKFFYSVAVEDWNRLYLADASSNLRSFIPRIDPSFISSIGCRLSPAAIQFVTVHGVFSPWFARTVPGFPVRCKDCGSDQDDPMHVLFDCPVWNTLRRQLLPEACRERPNDLLLPHSLPAFNAFCGAVLEVRRLTYSYT